MLITLLNRHFEGHESFSRNPELATAVVRDMQLVPDIFSAASKG